MMTKKKNLKINHKIKKNKKKMKKIILLLKKKIIKIKIMILLQLVLQ